MTLLFVAAEPREFSGLLRHVRQIERLHWPVDWARAADCGGRRFVLLANGAGPDRAGAATAAGLQRVRADGVVSTGFCGALDPALWPGDVFVASSVETDGGRFPARDPGAGGRRHASGGLASIRQVARTAAEKAQLRGVTGAGAVEMEAAGVAGEACRAGLPFYCIRSVTDRAGESFSIDFNALLQSDGHFDTMLLLGSIVRKPTVALPEVLRLWRRCCLATLTLGEFIADCRF
ncbi:MAG TPA: hypothetical protein VN442_06195 [Bryobacteraceae bacterium]|nr:hypothetical protein [Bryobacteraceae bacterium]